MSAVDVIVDFNVQEILLFLQDHQGFEFYSILTLALVASGCYFPISSDLVVITVTALAAATGFYDLPTIFVCIFSGLLIGDLINFSVAKKYGPKVLKSAFAQKFLKPDKIEKMTVLLKQSGEKYILLVRFMPLVRTFLYFSAGLVQFSTLKFLFFNALSTAVYLVALMALSYNIGTNIEKLSALVFKFELLFALLVILIISVVLYLRKRRLK